MREKDNMSKTKIRLYLDISLFVSFFFLNAPQFTGITLHEWASFVFIPAVILHILLDWKWIVSITKRIFKKLNGEIRFNYILDMLLFFFMTSMIVSGILISEETLPSLGIHIQIDPFWTAFHALSANLLMAIVGIHLALHWKWIVNNTKRYIVSRFNQSQIHVEGNN